MPTQLRPAMVRRLTKLPLVGNGDAWQRRADRITNRVWDYPRWLETRTRGIRHLSHRRSQLRESRARAARRSNHCHVSRPGRVSGRAARIARRHVRVACPGASPDRGSPGGGPDRLRQSGRRGTSCVSHDIVRASRVTVIPNGVHPTCTHRPDPRADREVEDCSARQVPSRWSSCTSAARSRANASTCCSRWSPVLREHWPALRLIRVGDTFHARAGASGAAAGARTGDHGAAVRRSASAGRAVSSGHDPASAVRARRVRPAGRRSDGLRDAGRRQPDRRADRGRWPRPRPTARSATSAPGSRRYRNCSRSGRRLRPTGARVARPASLQSRRFSWREHARRMTELYRDVIPHSPSRAATASRPHNERASSPASREVLPARSRRHRDRRRDAVSR